MEQAVERMMVPNTQLPVCLEMCSLRPWCKVAAFHSKARVCELYFCTINLDNAYREREACHAMMYFIRNDFAGDKVCSECESKVVKLESEEEEKFVTERFISLYESDTFGYWLGIKRTELHYLSYTNFDGGEPHDDTDATCLGIYMAANWKWIYLKCENDKPEYDMHVVCERVP